MSKKMTIAFDEGYKVMTADKKHEADALEWCHVLVDDMAGGLVD